MVESRRRWRARRLPDSEDGERARSPCRCARDRYRFPADGEPYLDCVRARAGVRRCQADDHGSVTARARRFCLEIDDRRVRCACRDPGDHEPDVARQIGWSASDRRRLQVRQDHDFPLACAARREKAERFAYASPEVRRGIGLLHAHYRSRRRAGCDAGSQKGADRRQDPEAVIRSCGTQEIQRPGKLKIEKGGIA